MTIEYLEAPAKGVRREIGYVLERGDYTFEQRTPVGRLTTRCRRKVDFDATPFPPGLAQATTYFAECSSKRD